MSAWKDFLHWLHDFGHETLDFITPLARQIAKAGGQALIEAAEKAVAAAETAGGSGEDKFKAAKEAVIAELSAAGIPIVVNAIHGAIIGAVAKLKE